MCSGTRDPGPCNTSAIYALGMYADRHSVGMPELMPKIGMRVQMAKGYTEQGVGTVVNIPDAGVCSVKWDSGLTEVRYCSAQ